MHDQPMLETLTTISESDRYNRWIFGQFQEHLHGCVLDIGSGIGDIVKYYDIPAVNKIIAADYSPIMVQKLSARFQNSKKYSVIRMDIASDEGMRLVSEQSVDVITCSNVLEHIEDDAAALNRMRRLLKPGGKLLILVPALPQIYGSLDRLVGHFRRYTKKTLGRALVESGFSLKQQHYMNMFGVVTWFIAGRVLKRGKFDQEACKTLDRVVPLLSMLERGPKPMWGQSLIAVGVNR